MAVVANRNFGVDAVLLVVAIVLFVLAAFSVHIGQFSPTNVAEFGLAFFAGSFLL